MARSLLVVLLAVASLACSTESDARLRLERAIARMEALESVRFEMRGSVRADSPVPEQAPAGGVLNQDIRARGEIAFPDRLHLIAEIDVPGEAAPELIIVGERSWRKIGGEWRRSTAVVSRSTNDPRASLEVLKGPGEARFAGYGLNGGALTYHVRIELDAAALDERLRRRGDALAAQMAGTGRIDVYIGVFDDRIYRQEVEITERSGDELAPGSGLYRIRTAYAIDYSAFDAPTEIREPR
jgi:hypothetical protein